MSILKRKNKVLILGKIPPPVGGVTIHVLRLIESLNKRGYQGFHFSNLGKESVWMILLKIIQYKAVHLHTSNTYFQLMIAVYCYLVNTRLIVTYHGNWSRHGLFKSFAAGISAWLTHIALVQNGESMAKIKKWNKTARQVSAYIPPSNVLPLHNNTLQSLLNYKTKYKYLFCTNAWKLTFDKYGQETYGISDLILNISKTRSALIISDPSGTYKKYVEEYQKEKPGNIFFITGAHEFWNVLKLSDAFIRNTTTDGDSISIHEALSCGTVVFASDCVTRPPQCRLYKDISEVNLEEEFETVKVSPKGQFAYDNFSTTEELILLYNECLKPGNKPCEKNAIW